MPERNDSVISAHQGPLVDPLPRTIRWPTYLVSAPYSVVQKAGAAHPRMPYGDWHAREVGSLQAVCGRSAVTWKFFWTLDFSDAGPLACPDCLRALRAR